MERSVISMEMSANAKNNFLREETAFLFASVSFFKAFI
jgi:hypothetical protein